MRPLQAGLSLQEQAGASGWGPGHTQQREQCRVRMQWGGALSMLTSLAPGARLRRLGGIWEMPGFKHRVLPSLRLWGRTWCLSPQTP